MAQDDLFRMLDELSITTQSAPSPPYILHRAFGENSVSTFCPVAGFLAGDTSGDVQVDRKQVEGHFDWNQRELKTMLVSTTTEPRKALTMARAYRSYYGRNVRVFIATLDTRRSSPERPPRHRMQSLAKRFAYTPEPKANDPSEYVFERRIPPEWVTRVVELGEDPFAAKRCGENLYRVFSRS
ncbi:hypothetical protein B0H16DRAFT_1575078, partial [Mycena metata]